MSSTPLPDKTDNVLGALEALSGSQTLPENSTPEPLTEGLFGHMSLPEKPITPAVETTAALPEIVLPSVEAPVSLAPSSPASIPEVVTLEETILPEVSIPSETIPVSDIPSVPGSALASEPVPVVSDTLSPLESAPVSESLPAVPVAPSEQKESETVPEKTAEPIKKETDPKLDLYLRADRVYQEMLRIENQEKIRLQLAIRYTLLMFAIFLVFAWIVSNRVIMFGFSEFVWLARIRDALFAVMAGLFSLTIWFGSVSWMRQIFLIALLRTIALVFFIAVIVALYIPLW